MIKELIAKESNKQDKSIQLIASENFVSQDVLDVQGSILTNKYAEGYPGARYYGGCEFIDQIEEYAKAKALEMMGNPEGYSVNVQPHSGSQANQSVYLAALNVGDTVLAMSLDHGGHLTHGYKLSSSGLYYDFHGYTTLEGKIDVDQICEMIKEIKPKLLILGGSSYPYEIDFEMICNKVRSVSSDILIMADVAHIAGLIVAGVHKSPFGHCDFITSTTHKTLRGPRGGVVFMKSEFEKQLNRAVFPGLQGGPLMHVIGAKGVAFNEACSLEFKAYSMQIINNTQAFVNAFNELEVVTTGSDNHMFMIDTFKTYNITGDVAEKVLEENDIIVNKNLLPNDINKPMSPSGIRIGTPAMTTKGYKEEDFRLLASKIHLILSNISVSN